jgi:hypothetical protein
MKRTFCKWGVPVILLAFGLALSACGSLGSLIVIRGAETAGPLTSEFRTRYDGDRNIVIVKYLGKGGAAAVPAEIEGIPVVAIDADAFDNAAGLVSVTIPASIVCIGDDVNDVEDAFDGSVSLASITVDEGNNVYSSQDGVLFNKSKTTLLLCPEGKKGSYTIPPSVTSIASYAFENCKLLTDVTIPDSVMSIGERSFFQCYGLTSITIPGSIKTITGGLRDGNGYGAFYGCTGLTSVVISRGVETIGDTAFYSCLHLNSLAIAETVTSIGDRSFAACEALSSLAIPDSVIYIGANAFAGGSALTQVSIFPVAGRKWDGIASGRGAFVECSRLNSAAKTAIQRAGYTGSF